MSNPNPNETMMPGPSAQVDKIVAAALAAFGLQSATEEASGEAAAACLIASVRMMLEAGTAPHLILQAIQQHLVMVLLGEVARRARVDAESDHAEAAAKAEPGITTGRTSYKDEGDPVPRSDDSGEVTP